MAIADPDADPDPLAGAGVAARDDVDVDVDVMASLKNATIRLTRDFKVSARLGPPAPSAPPRIVSCLSMHVASRRLSIHVASRLPKIPPSPTGDADVADHRRAAAGAAAAAAARSLATVVPIQRR